jgi:hypothetical protein
LGPIPDYHLKEGQIVRYRGMVQDMHNPVYFFSKFETVNKISGNKETRFGKYKETLECNVRFLFNSYTVISLLSNIILFIPLCNFRRMKLYVSNQMNVETKNGGRTTAFQFLL